MKNIKKLFKEKTSIKQELQKSLDNNTPVSVSILAKLVGISVYRVRKYCKTHNIDLNNYTKESLNLKVIKQKKTEEEIKKKNKKKHALGEPVNVKIKMTAPADIKIKID